MAAGLKKILFSGYYGFDNAGDEAVLAALCQIFRANLGGAGQLELVVLSAAPEKTAAAYAEYQIRAINRWDKKALWTELAGADLFCSGGGSLLQDVTSVRSVWYYTSLLRRAQKQGVPTIVLAQGLGPLRTGLGRWLTRRALAKCRLLSWRDAASKALAEEILAPTGINLPDYLVCDPVLLWQPEPVVQPAGSAEPTVALALRPWASMQPAAAARLIELLRQAGYRPVLLPYHLGEDEALAEKINAAVIAAGGQPAEIWRCASPQAAWAAVGRADLLLGMRLHSLIMAAAQGIPALAFSYDPKVEAFARQVQIPLTASSAELQPEQVLAQLQGVAARPAAYPLGKLVGSWQPLLAAIKRLLADK